MLPPPWLHGEPKAFAVHPVVFVALQTSQSLAGLVLSRAKTVPAMKQPLIHCLFVSHTIPVPHDDPVLATVHWVPFATAQLSHALDGFLAPI